MNEENKSLQSIRLNIQEKLQSRFGNQPLGGPPDDEDPEEQINARYGAGAEAFTQEYGNNGSGYSDSTETEPKQEVSYKTAPSPESQKERGDISENGTSTPNTPPQLGDADEPSETNVYDGSGGDEEETSTEEHSSESNHPGDETKTTATDTAEENSEQEKKNSENPNTTTNNEQEKETSNSDLSKLLNDLTSQQKTIQNLQNELRLLKSERESMPRATLNELTDSIKNLTYVTDSLRAGILSSLMDQNEALETQLEHLKDSINTLNEATRKANDQFASYSRSVHVLDKIEQRFMGIQRASFDALVEDTRKQITEIENQFKAIAENHQTQMETLGTRIQHKYEELINQSPWRTDNATLWLSISVALFAILSFVNLLRG